MSGGRNHCMTLRQWRPLPSPPLAVPSPRHGPVGAQIDAIGQQLAALKAPPGHPSTHPQIATRHKPPSTSEPRRDSMIGSEGGRLVSKGTKLDCDQAQPPSTCGPHGDFSKISAPKGVWVCVIFCVNRVPRTQIIFAMWFNLKKPQIC